MEDNEVKTLGDAVVLLRHEVGLTQEELAHRVGVSRETIRKIEAGITKRPRDKILDGLEKEIGLSRRRAKALIDDDQPTDDDDSVAALLVQIARIEDRERRRQAWDRLPESVQEAIVRLAQDILQDTTQRLQGVHPPSQPDQV